MSKSILKATFEESLRLNEDEFSKNFVKKNTEELIKKQSIVMTPKKYLQTIFLSLIFVILPNYLMVLINNLIVSNWVEEQYRYFNLLSYSLFNTFLLIWLGLIILSSYIIKMKFLFLYRSQFHILVTYLIWFVIEGNLFMLTMCYSFIGKTGVLIYVVISMLVGILLVAYRINTLKKLLFKLKLDKFDKLIITIKKY